VLRYGNSLIKLQLKDGRLKTNSNKPDTSTLTTLQLSPVLQLAPS
jgi:hypothetical protein